MNLQTFIYKVNRRVKGAYLQYVKRDAFTLAASEWFKRNGDATLRLDYPLTPNSVVWDVGGFRGEWTSGIVERFDCFVFIFEPVREYFTALQEKFRDNPKVKCFPFGLSGSSLRTSISLSGNGSSTLLAGEAREEILLRDVGEVAQELGIEQIDLMKINIEGGEYEVLPRMLQTGLVKRCRDLQIQFHNFVPDAENKRAALRQQLSRTHKLTYDFYFIWENWQRCAY